MSRDQAAELLAASESEIRSLGVARLALFGSVVRGVALPDSDVDVLVQFSPGQKTFGRFLALSELLEDLLGRPVELVTTERFLRSLGRISWRKRKISSEPREYLRHMDDFGSAAISTRIVRN